MTLGIRCALDIVLCSCAHHPDACSDHINYKAPEYNLTLSMAAKHTYCVSTPPPSSLWAGLIIEWRNKCICCRSILHSGGLCCGLGTTAAGVHLCKETRMPLLWFACLHGLLLLAVLCLLLLAVLCCAVLCCAVLCCAVLCCAVLCCAVLCCH